MLSMRVGMRNRFLMLEFQAARRLRLLKFHRWDKEKDEKIRDENRGETFIFFSRDFGHMRPSLRHEKVSTTRFKLLQKMIRGLRTGVKSE